LEKVDLDDAGAVDADDEAHFDVGGFGGSGDDGGGGACAFSGEFLEKVDEIGDKVSGLEDGDVDGRDQGEGAAMLGAGAHNQAAGFGDGGVNVCDGAIEVVELVEGHLLP